MSKNCKFIFHFYFLAILFLISGCSILFGIKEIKPVDEITINKYARKFNIPSTDNYEIDYSYKDYLLSFDTLLFREQIKNHSQPLQALYFVQSGKMVSFQINCYAGGFPNLNWNDNGIMDTFPPKQQAHVDDIVTLNNLHYLKPMKGTEKFAKGNVDYTVIVYWSIFMGRQSERFISLIQKNHKLAPDKTIKIIYANTDNFFAKSKR